MVKYFFFTELNLHQKNYSIVAFCVFSITINVVYIKYHLKNSCLFQVDIHIEKTYEKKIKVDI